MARTHTIQALVAQPQHTRAISDHNGIHIVRRPIVHQWGDFPSVPGGQIHAARLLEQNVIVHAHPADCGGVDYWGHLRDVCDQHVVK